MFFTEEFDPFSDIDILNGLEWTRHLEKQWNDNLEADNDLLWQYFGTQSGIFRKFPGML